MRLALTLVVTLLVSSCAFGTNAVGVGAQNRSSICEIIANPEGYSGQDISVRGIVRTDYFEFSGIADVGCPNRTIAFGPERNVQIGLSQFLSTLERVRGDQAHVVEVSAEGTLQWRQNQVPVLVLDVRAFSDPIIIERPEHMPAINPR